MKKYISILSLSTLMGAALAQSSPKPEDSEVWEPVPATVTPGKTIGTPPSDAITLFDGKNLDAWQNPQFKGEPTKASEVAQMLSKLDDNVKHDPAGWTIRDGSIVVKAGNGAIETRQRFGSMQLHIEWMSPKAEGKSGQGYSNSGIFLMGLYEMQVLNSYENKTYSNGQAASIYKQAIPLVNASMPPGTWQTYDIVFTAPVFDKQGKLVSPARITAFHNGVLVLNNFEIQGPTAYIGKPEYFAHPAKMPLRLQDHGDPVQYRNIWVREL